MFRSYAMADRLAQGPAEEREVDKDGLVWRGGGGSTVVFACAPP